MCEKDNLSNIANADHVPPQHDVFEEKPAENEFTTTEQLLKICQAKDKVTRMLEAINIHREDSMVMDGEDLTTTGGDRSLLSVECASPQLNSIIIESQS